MKKNITSALLFVVMLGLGLSSIALSQSFDSITLIAPVPPSVNSQSISGEVVGVKGTQTYYYWVVAKYASGNSYPVGPVKVDKVPEVLTSQNYVKLNWAGLANVTGYDVIRTSSDNGISTGKCSSCAVTTTGVSLSDNGSLVFGNYTVSSAPPATANIRLDNQSSSTPKVLIPDIKVPSVTFNDGSSLTSKNFASGKTGDIQTKGSDGSLASVGANCDPTTQDCTFGNKVISTAVTTASTYKTLGYSPTITNIIAYSMITDGKYLYVSNQPTNGSTPDALYSFDISNPASITTKTSTSEGLTANKKVGGMVLNGKYLYTAWMAQAKINIYDVSNGTFVLAGTFSTGTGTQPYSLAISGNYLFVGFFTTNDVKVYDISNISNITLRATIPMGAARHTTLQVVGNYLYVDILLAAKFAIFDISNLDAVVAKGFVDFNTYIPPTASSSFQVVGNYAYVNGTTFMQIFNISNPDSITLVSTIKDEVNIGVPKTFLVNNNILYLVSTFGRLTTYDVTTPATPVLTGTSDTGITVGTGGQVSYGIALNGNTLFFAIAKTGTVNNVIAASNITPLGVNTPRVVFADGSVLKTASGTGGGLPTGCTDSGTNGITCTGPISASSFVATDTTKSGGSYYQGVTSGGVALAVGDVAGTAITYVLPTTNGVAGQVLTDGGAITCPTLPVGYPAVCHLMVWSNSLTLIGSGTATLGTGALAANTCASPVTVSITGALTTDVIMWLPSADISSVTGYGALSTDGLIIYPFITADNANFRLCNGTGSSITPGSAVTLNFMIIRRPL